MNNTQNKIQYILNGGVPASNLKFLLHRLKGLCDQATINDQLFEEHEAVYVMKNRTNSSQSVSLRVKRSLLAPDKPHQVQYLGSVEGLDANRAASMRTAFEVKASDNITTYLEQIGFVFDYETVLRGYSFRKGPMRINVFRAHKIPDKGDFKNILPMTDSYLVELTLHTAVQQDHLCEEMKTFAEHLKPLVKLDNIEKKRDDLKF